MAGQINIIALKGVPLVHPGDDLVEIIINALTLSNQCLKNGDVLVIAQKIISKAEGRIVALDSVSPSERAEKLAIANLCPQRRNGSEPQQMTSSYLLHPPGKKTYES